MSGASYREDFIHLYHGKASVLVALAGKEGRITVRAYAEGMQCAEMMIYGNRSVMQEKQTV